MHKHMYSQQELEERWDSYFASSDYMRERHHQEIEQSRTEMLVHEEEMNYRTKLIEAGFSDTPEGHDEYENYWSRVYEYFSTVYAGSSL